MLNGPKNVHFDRAGIKIHAIEYTWDVYRCGIIFAIFSVYISD